MNRESSLARLSVVSVADRSGYHIFASALRASDHGARLEGEGAFTLFAPSDAAFGAYSPVELEAFLRDRERLNTVVGYHIAVGCVLAQRFAGKRIRAIMQDGGDVLIDGRNGLRVNAANVTKPDLSADNGVVHGIDAILQPPRARVSALS